MRTLLSALALVTAVACGGGAEPGAPDAGPDAGSDPPDGGSREASSDQVPYALAFGSPVSDQVRGFAVDAEGGAVMLLEGYERVVVGDLMADVSQPLGTVLARFDAAGEPQWLETVSWTRASAEILTLGPAHEVIFAGNGVGQVDTGDWQSNTDSPFTFVVARTAAHEHRWARIIPNAYVLELAASDAGIAVAGLAEGEVDFGDGPRAMDPAGEMFIAVYDHDGELLWAATFAGASGAPGGDAFPHGLAIAPDGRVVVAGTVAGSVDFGDGPIATDYSESNGWDQQSFAAVFAPAGNVAWSRKLATNERWGVQNPAVDLGPNGDVAVLGRMYGSADFGNGVALSTTTDSPFVLVFDDAGQPRWGAAFDGGEMPHALDVDAAGTATLTGYASNETIRPPGSDPVPIPAGQHIFVATLADGGALRDLEVFATSGSDFDSYGGAGIVTGGWGQAVATTPDGDLLVAGFFAGAIAIRDVSLQSDGAFDLFLARLAR